MGKFIFIFLLLFSTLSLEAQKIYKVKYESQADIKVYIVDYESQADLNVYYVKYESQAGWRNNSKRHLLDF